MNSLDQFRHGLNRIWDNLAEGWQHLRERAGQAMTQFSPAQRSGRLETPADRLAYNAARWGLLAAEISEHDDHVLVRLEVPGMESEDFDLSVVDGYLLIRGEKKVQHEQKEGRYYALECAYGRFERTLPLPAAVDENKTQAKYKRGILSVRLPKTKAGAARRIKIESH